MKRSLVVVCLLLMSVQLQAAEVFCTGTVGDAWDKISAENRARLGKSECLAATIAGKIESGDYNKISEFLGANLVLYLDLDSPGGDVAEAIQIGLLVRRLLMLTMIPSGSSCDSSCFFIWAGGIYRQGDPTIHRPYLEDQGAADLTLLEADRLYSDIAKEIEGYLDEIDIRRHLPAEFVSRMLATPPDEGLAISSFDHESPMLRDRFEPGIEQYLLDSCVSLENKSCVRNKFIAERLAARKY